LKIADLEEQLKSKNPTELEARIKDITELKEKFENVIFHRKFLFHIYFI